MTQIPLEYGTRSANPKRGRILLIVGTVAFLLIVLFTWPRLEALWRWKIPFLRQQSRCMNFSLPPQQVAYEEQAAQAKRLSPGKTAGPGWATSTEPGGNILTYYLVPDVLPLIDPQLGFLITRQSYALFLHSRQALGGEPRLVYIRLDDFFALRDGSGKQQISGVPAIDWTVLKPGTLFSSPGVVAQGTWDDSQDFHSQMPAPLRIYFGQPDPSDDSHFTIPFRTPRYTGVIHGQLQPNDQLKFTIQTAPLNPTSAP